MTTPERIISHLEHRVQIAEQEFNEARIELDAARDVLSSIKTIVADQEKKAAQEREQA